MFIESRLVFQERLSDVPEVTSEEVSRERADLLELQDEVLEDAVALLREGLVSLNKTGDLYIEVADFRTVALLTNYNLQLNENHELELMGFVFPMPGNVDSLKFSVVSGSSGEHLLIEGRGVDGQFSFELPLILIDRLKVGLTDVDIQQFASYQKRAKEWREKQDAQPQKVVYLNMGADELANNLQNNLRKYLEEGPNTSFEKVFAAVVNNRTLAMELANYYVHLNNQAKKNNGDLKEFDWDSPLLKGFSEFISKNYSDLDRDMLAGMMLINLAKAGDLFRLNVMANIRTEFDEKLVAEFDSKYPDQLLFAYLRTTITRVREKRDSLLSLGKELPVLEKERYVNHGSAAESLGSFGKDFDLDSADKKLLFEVIGDLGFVKYVPERYSKRPLPSLPNSVSQVPSVAKEIYELIVPSNVVEIYPWPFGIGADEDSHKATLLEFIKRLYLYEKALDAVK